MEPSGRRTVLSIFATVINVNNEVSAFVVNKCCYTYNIELCVSGFCTQSISAYRIFGLPTRAWELGYGVIIALSQQSYAQFSPNINRRVTEAGFLLICVGFVFIDERTSTPGVSTLLPVLGTTLILIGGNEKGVINSILKQKLMVFIGLISYSLYVWHQPLFSLFSDLNNASLLLSTFILSILSWKFVEKPFRTSQIKGRIVIGSFISWAVILIFSGLFLVSKDGLRDRYPVYKNLKEQTLWEKSLTRTEDCEEIYGENQFCTIYFPGKIVTDAILGDSIANHFAIGLGQHLSKLNRNLLNLGAGGCPPLLDVSTGYHPIHGRNLNCFARTHSAYQAVLKDLEIENVYLSFSQYSVFDPRLAYSDNLMEFDFENNRYEAVLGTLMRTIRAYENAGKKVVLIGDLPNVSMRSFEKCLLKKNDFDACLEKLFLFAEEPLFKDLIEDLQREGVKIINTDDALDHFPYTAAGDLLYRDQTHLSREGSLYFAEKISKQLDLVTLEGIK